MVKCCVSGVEPSVSDLPLSANSCQSRMTNNRTSSWTYWIKHRWQIRHPHWQLLWKKAWLFLFFPSKPSDRFRNPQSFIVNEYRGISPRTERARLEDDRLLSSGEVKPLNAELNPICHLLALLGGATIVVVSRLRVKSAWSCISTSQHAVMACSSLQLVLSALFCAMYVLYHLWVTK